ncbi:hypothetical protein VNI00_006982 [Paramarasmius palmivorus]|uniref:Protein kinase domain-containing protein n=1 Tax=Paramarasmius palmivorus TaxID=297713 RepID=A0AAW0D2Q9_9AGAR
MHPRHTLQLEVGITPYKHDPQEYTARPRQDHLLDFVHNHASSTHSSFSQSSSSVTPGLPRGLSRPLTHQEQEKLAHLDRLKFFLAHAPSRWNTGSIGQIPQHPPGHTPSHPALNRFLLPSQEFVTCALWDGLYHITGTDIVRALVYRFEAFGRPVRLMKKFEEGVFSYLRYLMPGQDACLEESKSQFLDLLFKYECIRTQKKQKVFYWFSVPHDRLFLDALERDLKREKMGIEPTTVVVGEPAASFVYDGTFKRSLYDQFVRAAGGKEGEGDLERALRGLEDPTGIGSSAMHGSRGGNFGAEDGYDGGAYTSNDHLGVLMNMGIAMPQLPSSAAPFGSEYSEHRGQFSDRRDIGPRDASSMGSEHDVNDGDGRESYDDGQPFAFGVPVAGATQPPSQTSSYERGFYHPANLPPSGATQGNPEWHRDTPSPAFSTTSAPSFGTHQRPQFDTSQSYTDSQSQRPASRPQSGVFDLSIHDNASSGSITPPSHQVAFDHGSLHPPGVPYSSGSESGSPASASSSYSSNSGIHSAMPSPAMPIHTHSMDTGMNALPHGQSALLGSSLNGGPQRRNRSMTPSLYGIRHHGRPLTSSGPYPSGSPSGGRHSPGSEYVGVGYHPHVNREGQIWTKFKLGPRESQRLRDTLMHDEDAILELLNSAIESDGAKFREVLSLQGEAAQRCADLIQDVLDMRAAVQHERTYRAQRLLVKLCQAQDILPSSLFIKGVYRQDIDAHLGGSFGDIYRATYKDSDVAIKRIRIFQDTADRHKLQRGLCREAILWRMLKHPFVLPFLGVDPDTFPGMFCLVSPYMANGTILNHLLKSGGIDVDLRLSEIAQGLSYLHSQSVVHGDLRGANILVDSDRHVRIADFGLTVLSDTTVGTNSSHHAGSVRWMAPELHYPASCGLTFSQRTFASDVYSFACVCVELYTGKAPFEDAPHDTAVLLRVIAKERPARPSRIGDWLWNLVNLCWSHDRAERPSMSKVVEIVQNAVII